jgi:hypothetical protein
MATVGSCSGHEEEDVLLDGHAHIGNKPNHTTAVDFTRNFERLVASFWRAPPPLPSTLYVYSPDISDPAAFSEAPRIIRMVRGFILFRVVIRSRHRFCIPMEDFDYFVYNVHGRALYRITNPAPLSFHDDVVGLLPRPFRWCPRPTLACSRSTYFTRISGDGHPPRWFSRIHSKISQSKSPGTLVAS